MRSHSLDSEAVEMAMRSAMRRAGAAALSRLLSMDASYPAQLDCACGQTARYQRPKHLLTVLGRSRSLEPGLEPGG